MSASNESLRSLRESITDLLGSLYTQLRAAFSVGIPRGDPPEAHGPIDPDFERWLRNDPMITGNPASRYSDDSPGRLTSNGLGSLEIGAADD